MPSDLLHRLLLPPTIPGPRGNVYLRRIRQRTNRRRVVRLDRQHGILTRSIRVPTSMLLTRRNRRAFDSHSLDLQSRVGMVCVLLHHGLSPPFFPSNSKTKPLRSEPQPLS